jgi:bifunctional DNA-binding transcriptional regulator/antitoxin component of YhaV-PrlF toxin-antitoxin module
MRITSKGQVTIPQHIREAAGFLPHTSVEFVLERDGTVRLVKSRGEAGERLGGSRGQEIVRRLKGRGDVKLSTDQIMALTRGGE